MSDKTSAVLPTKSVTEGLGENQHCIRKNNEEQPNINSRQDKLRSPLRNAQKSRPPQSTMGQARSDRKKYFAKNPEGSLDYEELLRKYREVLSSGCRGEKFSELSKEESNDVFIRSCNAITNKVPNYGLQQSNHQKVDQFGQNNILKPHNAIKTEGIRKEYAVSAKQLDQKPNEARRATKMAAVGQWYGTATDLPKYLYNNTPGVFTLPTHANPVVQNQPIKPAYNYHNFMTTGHTNQFADVGSIGFKNIYQSPTIPLNGKSNGQKTQTFPTFDRDQIGNCYAHEQIANLLPKLYTLNTQFVNSRPASNPSIAKLNERPIPHTYNPGQAKPFPMWDIYGKVSVPGWTNRTCTNLGFGERSAEPWQKLNIRHPSSNTIGKSIGPNHAVYNKSNRKPASHKYNRYDVVLKENANVLELLDYYGYDSEIENTYEGRKDVPVKKRVGRRRIPTRPTRPGPQICYRYDVCLNDPANVLHILDLYGYDSEIEEIYGNGVEKKVRKLHSFSYSKEEAKSFEMRKGRY